jgi:hypothetical protein
MLSPSISSAGDTPANPSLSPVLDEDTTIPDIYGPGSPTPFAYYDPDGHCLRTSQGTLDLDLTPSSVTLPPSGSMSNGRLYRRRPLVPRTSVTGSSLLHTPTAKANQDSPSMRDRDKGSWFRPMWPTPVAHDDNKSPEAHMAMKRRMKGGPRQTITSLQVMVKAVERQMWPTPRARLGAQRGAQAKRYSDPARSNDLDDAVAASGTPGQLNPTWVEWLMGFPLGFTDLSASGTP